MPHFSAETGRDVVLCQKCTRLVDTGKEDPQWRPDITGNASTGTVCDACVAQYERERRRPDHGGSQ